VNGMMQVNIQIPQVAPRPPLLILMRTAISQPNITVAVK
jgi:hypothetical protein